MIRVNVKPELLRWTHVRTSTSMDTLTQRFPNYPKWENGEAEQTLLQVEQLAKLVHTQVGYFFLSSPSDEPLPIRDSRTVENAPLRRLSLSLRKTLYLCQQRQDWVRDFERVDGVRPLKFIGSMKLASKFKTVTTGIRRSLHLELDDRRNLPKRLGVSLQQPTL